MTRTTTDDNTEDTAMTGVQRLGDAMITTVAKLAHRDGKCVVVSYDPIVDLPVFRFVPDTRVADNTSKGRPGGTGSNTVIAEARP